MGVEDGKENSIGIDTGYPMVDLTSEGMVMVGESKLELSGDTI